MLKRIYNLPFWKSFDIIVKCSLYKYYFTALYQQFKQKQFNSRIRLLEFKILLFIKLMNFIRALIVFNLFYNLIIDKEHTTIKPYQHDLQRKFTVVILYLLQYLCIFSAL